MELHLTLLVVFGSLVLMAATNIGTDLILMAALTVLLTAGVVEPERALAGFANEGLLTIAVLYVVAAGMRDTGAATWWVRRTFGRPRSVAGAQARMMGQVALLSAFMNNTPVVATFLPAVRDWARQHRISPSRLLMPLSFAAILGGGCTLFGSSTNLIVAGALARDHAGVGFGLFEIAWLGIPLALAGVLYTLTLGRWLLRDRVSAADSFANPKEYTVEMLVPTGSPLAGRSVVEAGLRSLPGLYLVEIERGGHVLSAVGPDEVLVGEDRLVFAGMPESIVDLYKIDGLRATESRFDVGEGRHARQLVEVVVARGSVLVGKSIRESRFRSAFSASVIAVARHGERVKKKVGDIVVQPADTLLLEADRGFVGRQRQSRDFLLVSSVAGATLPKRERQPFAWVAMIAMIALAASGVLSLLNAALLAAGVMLAAGCVSGPDARRSIDISVLVSVAAAFGLGEALTAAGAVDAAVSLLAASRMESPTLILGAIYGLTSLLTLFITNNAAAILVLPSGLALADSVGLAPEAAAVAVMFGAAMSFATPTGYQTNLMVYGVGGYRFADYLRFGLPLQILLGVLAVALIPAVWSS